MEFPWQLFMSTDIEQEICPKHRIVMKNGTCKMCQAEFYNENYRIYGKKENNPSNVSTRKKFDGKKNKGKKRNSLPDKNRPITNEDLQKLVNKFNKNK